MHSEAVYELRAVAKSNANFVQNLKVLCRAIGSGNRITDLAQLMPGSENPSRQLFYILIFQFQRRRFCKICHNKLLRPLNFRLVSILNNRGMHKSQCSKSQKL